MKKRPLSEVSTEDAELQTAVVESISSSPAAELMNVKWELKELNGVRVNSETLSGEAIYIRFVDSISVEGFAGCNRFFGSYKIAINKLKIGSVGSTRMYCGEDNVEQKMLNVLNEVDSYKRDANHLQFISKGNTIAKFEAL